MGDAVGPLRVRDHQHLRRLVFGRVWTIEGIERTETFVCLAKMPAKQSASGLRDEMEVKPESVTECGGPGSGVP